MNGNGGDEMAMLEKVKPAMRITVDAYDSELQMLIDAALLDMQIAGIRTESEDALITRAVITYCRMNFGSPEDYDKLKKSYDEQKAQMWMNSNYTDWLEDEV